ncbi:hypothetical protein GCHA_0594 [Paraglaciecola chathamensis S18K6]|uniref:Uncharacterized protein n=1 Tax=Paraglaciecola chathamensis S18K6 TaxID=1127672 RepID=A0AAV3UU11_9ALTE|nr:hypothetical protein GCHA_0594 [Paraglaciecola chathamensis S18K6]
MISFIGNPFSLLSVDIICRLMALPRDETQIKREYYLCKQ